jgi:hypothetical protein
MVFTRKQIFYIGWVWFCLILATYFLRAVASQSVSMTQSICFAVIILALGAELGNYGRNKALHWGLIMAMSSAIAVIEWTLGRHYQNYLLAALFTLSALSQARSALAHLSKQKSSSVAQPQPQS